MWWWGKYNSDMLYLEGEFIWWILNKILFKNLIMKKIIKDYEIL